MEPTALLEEPISPELVLVDRELAVRARAASADPPWLLPVLAELKRREEAQPAVAVDERSAAQAPPHEPRPPLWKHIRATVVFGCVLVGLVAVVSLVPELLSTSNGPTFVTARAEQAPTSTPTRSAGHGRARHVARRPRTQAAVKPKAAPKRKATRAPSKTRSAVATRPSERTPGRKKAPKPTAGAAVNVQRVFSWHRAAGAVYYEFYLRRGATTIYQARTTKLTAALPARLKLTPGTYQAFVRPAIPTDAGIFLGTAILEKTIRF